MWTLSELAEKYGKKYSTLYCRLYAYDFTLEKALTLPVRNGDITKWVRHWSKITGICEDTLRTRVYRYKLTPEQAAKMQVTKTYYFKPMTDISLKPNIKGRRWLYG